MTSWRAASGFCVFLLALMPSIARADASGQHYEKGLLVPSEKGLFTVEIVPSASGLVVGLNSFELILHDDAGREVPHAELTVVPLAPEGGKPAAAAPNVRERGGGLYSLEDVQLGQPGDWVLEIRIREGSRKDTVRLTLHRVGTGPPDRADIEETLASYDGHFTVGVWRGAFVPMHQIYGFRLSLKSRDGTPVTGAEFIIEGGMPAHGHGLISKPVVLPEQEPGLYRVQGFKFHMPGIWVIRFHIRDRETRDTLLVHLQVGNRAEANAGEIHTWTEDDVRILTSLWIESLPPPPPNPSNAQAGNPAAAALGKKLFFDPRFSGNLEVSCATCHRPDYGFTDSLPLAHGMGTTTRRTMPLIGMAYQTWFFWDGRKDSLWSQALGPLESPVEHGITRTFCFLKILEHYREEYEAVFGPIPEIDPDTCPPVARPSQDDAEAMAAWLGMPEENRDSINRVYANMGKAIEAYVRTIMPQPSRFDDYVRHLGKGDRKAMMDTLTAEEALGLRLFIGKGQCINCHNSPLFSNGEFHDTGLRNVDGNPEDPGRSAGIPAVLEDEFNCLGPYSDATPEECVELRFMDTATEKFTHAFKTVSLRNVALRPPYMHAGQFNTLGEVLSSYREIDRIFDAGEGYRPDIRHGRLTDEELGLIEGFLWTLNSPLEGL